MIAPETEITLYKTDVEIDELNNIKFNTWTDQWNYFSSLPKLYLDEATYQRKEGVIRYPNNGVPFDELLRYNYVSYKNSSYSSKTFFAFIKNMRYVNDGMTEIEIESDVWQTWQFDIIYRKCFTEREHVKDDTFGLHTVPEGLETGEYMYQELNKNQYYKTWQEAETTVVGESPYCIVVATSDRGFDTAGWSDNTTYNGVPNGFYYIAFPNSLDLMSWIYAMQSLPSNKTEAIYCIFVCYNKLCGLTHNSYEQKEWRGYTFYVAEVDTLIHDEVKPGYLKDKMLIDSRIVGESYKPKNNKLLCYPYRYINISNNAGQTNQYRWEYFRRNTELESTCEFGVVATLSPGCNIKLYPRQYNVSSVQDPASIQAGWVETCWYNFNEGLDGPKLPTCGWPTDAFLNWLSQNGVNLIGQTAVNVAQVVGGAAMVASGAAAPVGATMAVSGAAGIAGTMVEGVKAKLEPDTAHGGANSGTLNFACQRLFTPYLMSIRDEYAKIIDDYFTMFGYKVNALKVPEIHSRKNWNYIKTIDCNFSGDIPGSELEKIRSLFNRGITLWHNPKTFLDYSQVNNII